MPGARINLFELLLRDRNNSALAPEHDRSAGGRALVEGQNVAFHALSIASRSSFEALRSLIPKYRLFAEIRFVGHVASERGVIAEHFVFRHRLARLHRLEEVPEVWFHIIPIVSLVSGGRI